MASTATTEAEIRETLQRIAGVQPAQHWLQDCLVELRASGSCTADAVLQQILHHDLRDVVRVLDDVSGASTLTSSSQQHRTVVDPNHPAVVLRRAIQDSIQTAPYRTQLPPDFRLLCQVEEFLDVSQNAETRLSVGPASPMAPAAVGNQQNRCLKFCVADGYTAAGSAFYSADENARHETLHTAGQQPSSVFVAMEIEPVTALSVNSKAGCKVLLQGPLSIRHGVVLWQPVWESAPNATTANGPLAATTARVTVLGGCVAELVVLQSAALQQAKLVAGVGIDPTIRALIWNPETGEMQEDDNEGEHESRDLEPGAGAPPAQQVAVPPLPPLPLRPVPPLANASVNPPQRPQPRAVVPQSRPSQVASVAHRQPPTTTASVSVSATSTRNPYASSSSSGLLGSTTSNPYQTNRSQTVSTTAAQMPLQRPPLTNTNGGGGTTGSCTPVDIEDMMMMSLDSNSSANSKKKRRTDQVVASRAAVRPRPETGMAASVSSAMTAPYASSNGSAPISFAELRSRLVQARENEALYCSMFGQSFLVQARQKGGKLGFNIEKVKSSKDGKKVKKYGYLMSARFQDVSGHGELVTCKISNEILEPFFCLPPSEMRSLSREDRKKSEELTRNGGKMVQEALFQTRLYDMTLLLSPDEFFRSATDPMPPLDGTNPVLHLVKRCD